MLYMPHGQGGFNIPGSVFEYNCQHITFSRIGGFLRNGYIGPDLGCAVSNSKITSFIKSFSEAVERRALMYGGISNNNRVETWDIVKEQKSYLPYEMTTYSIKKPYPIDTTGSAVHKDSKKAVYNAIKELIEKNALFLLWYGKMGIKIRKWQYSDNVFYNLLKKKYEKVIVVLNDYFHPLKVVVTFAYNIGEIPIGGIGASFNLNEAINISLSEMYLINYEKEFIIHYKTKYISRYKYSKDKVDEYLEYIGGYDELRSYNNEENEGLLNECNTVTNIIECLPSWVTNLHVVYLPQTLNTKLKCVKVFSYDLFNHIPIKEFINIEGKINSVIDFGKSDLDSSLDCIVK